MRYQFEWVDIDVTQVASVESRSLSLASNDNLERSNFLGSLLKVFKQGVNRKLPGSRITSEANALSNSKDMQTEVRLFER